MPSPSRLLWFVRIAAISIGLTAFPGPSRAADRPGIAVVELFTSEGCSSCPPADAALAELIKSDSGRPVYALAFHVDYWDRLGWRDPFADAAYSERQREYGRAFRLDSVYTPQSVVNGRREFVGSARRTLRESVDAALAIPAVGELTATPSVGKETVQVDINSKDLPAGTPVRVALVQRGLSSKVARGENGGRTLIHENVVRSFARIMLDDAGRGKVLLNVPSGADIADLSVIAYAQRDLDHHVIAATRAELFVQ